MSVVLPVYNGRETLARAVHSIMTQTLDHLELIVVDDGSSDASVEVLEPWTDDARLCVVTNESNQGLVATLNRGVTLARAPLVARLDQDDWSAPTRLERQAAEFDDPRVVLCATAYDRVDLTGELNKRARPPMSHAELSTSMLLGNGIQHSSVMFRRDRALEVGLYDPEWYLAEDYDLWLKLMELGEYRCLSTVESAYTDTPEGISNQRADAQLSIAAKRASVYRARLIGDAVPKQSSGSELVREVNRAARALRRELRRRGIDVDGVDRRALLAVNRALRDDNRAVRAVKILAVAPRVAILGRIPGRPTSDRRSVPDHG